MHTYMHACTHIHTHTHTCMHACMHTYMHAYIQPPQAPSCITPCMVGVSKTSVGSSEGASGAGRSAHGPRMYLFAGGKSRRSTMALRPGPTTHSHASAARHLYLCVHVCMCVRACVRARACMRVRVCAHACVRASACVRVCLKRSHHTTAPAVGWLGLFEFPVGGSLE